MTTIYNLRAATNVTFRLTRDFSNLAQVYDVASSTIRMQARVSAFATEPPIYEWCSSNASGGQVAFDPSTGLCVFSAPAADMAQMPALLVYDCRLELINGAIASLFSGRLAFAPGVTRTSLDTASVVLSSIGDTVTVDGESSTSPAVLPTSLTTILSAAQASATAAATSAQSASVNAQALAGQDVFASLYVGSQTDLTAIVRAALVAHPEIKAPLIHLPEGDWTSSARVLAPNIKTAENTNYGVAASPHLACVAQQNTAIDKPHYFDAVYRPQRILKQTWGTHDNACGFSVIANATGDQQAQVIAFGAPASLANYPDRDTVSLYVENTLPAPRVTITSATFTATTVVPPSPLSADQVASLRVGMIIDTNDSPYYSGFISDWASDGSSITVSGWYKQGNTATGQVPAGNTAFVNSVTKVWGQNTVVNLNGASHGSDAIGYELDMMNNKATYNAITDSPSFYGFDAVNLGAYGTSAGFRARGNHWNGYYSVGSKNAGFFAAANYPSQEPAFGFLSMQKTGNAFAVFVNDSLRFAVGAATGNVAIGPQAAGVTGSPTLSLCASGNSVADAALLAYGGSATAYSGQMQAKCASLLVFTPAAAANITLTPAASGGTVSIAATGGDANIPLLLDAKGTGGIKIGSSASSKLSFFGGAVVSRPTGYGTPVNGSLVADFPGTSATLAQCGGMLSTLITQLKNYNLLGA